MSDRMLTRRSALSGVLVLVAGGVAGYLSAHNSAAAKKKRGTTAANAYGPAPSGSNQRVAALADIPVGGAIVLSNPAIVLVRGAGDAVHALSAVCTHQGCTVDEIEEGTIQCPCHGSRFELATGKVTNGPASRPLPTVAVVVRNGEVFTS